MVFFKKKKNSYLGIDVGSTNVKMVELAIAHGKAVLKNYGFAERKNTQKSQGEESAVVHTVSELIKKICAESGFETRCALAALHNFDVFTSVINLPGTTLKNQLGSIIQGEARKFVPIPIEDVILDWKLIHGEKGTGKDTPKKEDKKNKDEVKNAVTGGMDVLLTAAPRKLVKRYLDIFQAADLNLLSLETESFALIRSLLDRHETSSIMVIDIGSVSSDIIIVEEQIPVVTRTVDVGGNFITNAIARNLGITADRAEQFKRDIGIYAEEGSNATDNVLEEVIESAFSTVINEVNYSIDLYKTRNRTIEKIILSGGSAWLAGLTDFLKNLFNLPVYIGNPWYKVDYPLAMEAQLQEIGPLYAVSVGLALKEIVE